MKEGADFSNVTHYTQVDVQPGGINIQNVEHLYQADILKQLGIELAVKQKGETKIEEDGDLIARLKPIFFNNEDDAALFLKEIRGMSAGDVTDLVNRWVQEKRISDYGNSRKGDLWSILHDAGLYGPSRQNWCRRVY